MRTKLFLAVILCIGLCFYLTSCKDKKDEITKDSIVGTWEHFGAIVTINKITTKETETIERKKGEEGYFFEGDDCIEYVKIHKDGKVVATSQDGVSAILEWEWMLTNKKLILSTKEPQLLDKNEEQHTETVNVKLEDGKIFVTNTSFNHYYAYGDEEYIYEFIFKKIAD